MDDYMTISETVKLLHNYEIICDEKDVRQWIAEGDILATANGKAYDITESTVLDFIVDLSNVGTAYEKGIDNQTKIERLMAEVIELQQEVDMLRSEKMKLENQLGILPF